MPDFPRKITLGPRRVAYDSADVERFIASQKAKSSNDET
jgi:predicted DNA-binding transcriptional regulator AlpA